MNNEVSPSSALRLAALIGALRAALGGWCLRGFFGERVALALHWQLGVMARRISGLAGRFAAGQVRRRAVGSAAPVRAARTVVSARVVPVQFAWLVRVAGYQAAGFGCQLRAILEDPEMQALLRAVPQARRVLRPLCRMLAVEASVLEPVAESVSPAVAWVTHGGVGIVGLVPEPAGVQTS
jgi:hypothetical protein